MSGTGSASVPWSRPGAASEAAGGRAWAPAGQDGGGVERRGGGRIAVLDSRRERGACLATGRFAKGGEAADGDEQHGRE
ncbi:hypothetical protein GCM10027440_05150 [Nocardiopsis coralliicola]